jgi:hypothetical protein
MFRHELAVEKREIAGLEPRDEPGERNFRRIAHPAEHALAEEGTAELHAVKPADQLATLADLDRMGVAGLVKGQHRPLELAVDPGLLALGARGDDGREVEVVGDLEPARPKRTLQRP